MNSPVSIYAWSFVASFAAIGAEVIFLHSRAYWDTFPVPLILSAIVSFGIWKMMEAGRSITGCLVVFNFSNVILRMLLSAVQRKNLHWTSWIALGFIVLANVLKNLPRFLGE